MERIEADHGLRGMCANGFRERRAEIHRYGFDLCGPSSGRASVKKRSRVAAFLPGAPHTILPVSWSETSVK